jgi:glycerate 2-kinase
MNILIACDSFKDALSAPEVCQAIAAGWLMAHPETQTTIFPLADGGEGTSEILGFHLNFDNIECTVHDPLFRPTTAVYGFEHEAFKSGDLNERNERVAFIEMAQAAGLQKLTMDERNPLKTSTFGVGEMILEAVRRGATKIVLAIGGSATNDGGIGMAAALGYRFLDENGEKLTPIGGNLSKIKTIQTDFVKIDLSKIQVEAMCDVNNPLFGERGAAYVYARQKGADDKMIEELDEGLKNLADIVSKTTSLITHHLSPITNGAGAAGGLGYGAMVFLNATLKRGIELILDATNFDKALIISDLVITGEGRLDSQTAQGKLISGIVNRAKQHRKPVIALCGALDAPPQYLQDLGVLAAFPIGQKPMNLTEALEKTKENLTKTAFNVARVFGN